MSFSVSFFARDTHAAQRKLQEAYVPASVKALIELAIAGIPAESRQDNAGAGAAQSGGSSGGANGARTNEQVNRASPAPRRLAGIKVETFGHIDDRGERSWIDRFSVEPYYD